jgi:hypothetical protein
MMFLISSTKAVLAMVKVSFELVVNIVGILLKTKILIFPLPYPVCDVGLGSFDLGPVICML